MGHTLSTPDFDFYPVTNTLIGARVADGATCEDPLAFDGSIPALPEPGVWLRRVQRRLPPAHAGAGGAATAGREHRLLT